MQRRRLLPAFAMLALLAGGASAQPLTPEGYQNAPVWSGTDLAGLCAAKADGAMGTAAINLCHGYARGSVAAYTQIEAASRRKLKLFCLPADAGNSASAILAGFPAWVGADAARGKDHAVDALFGYLREKFPCGK